MLLYASFGSEAVLLPIHFSLFAQSAEAVMLLVWMIRQGEAREQLYRSIRHNKIFTLTGLFIHHINGKQCAIKIPLHPLIRKSQGITSHLISLITTQLYSEAHEQGFIHLFIIHCHLINSITFAHYFIHFYKERSQVEMSKEWCINWWNGIVEDIHVLNLQDHTNSTCHEPLTHK